MEHPLYDDLGLCLYQSISLTPFLLYLSLYLSTCFSRSLFALFAPVFVLLYACVCVF